VQFRDSEEYKLRDVACKKIMFGWKENDEEDETKRDSVKHSI